MEVNSLFISATAKGGFYFERFNHLGKYFKGHCISAANDSSTKLSSSNNFTYHFYKCIRKGSLYFKLLETIVNSFLLFIACFKLLNKEKSINLIVVRTPFIVALIAITLGWFFKKKTLIEINGNFKTAFRFERVSGPQKIDIIKEFIGCKIIKYVLKHISGIKLLYPTQIDCFGNYSNKPVAAFHDFVPISKILDHKTKSDNYLLTLGYPWYLKGVDTLIIAFKQLSTEFPQYRLKVHGWCPYDRNFFENLAKENNSIELNSPVNYDEAISLIANCSIFILASRTEAMGRVLLEAMACKKAIIAANVGGIPSVVKNGYNGLLFEAGDASDLYSKIKKLLSEPAFAQQLASNGYTYVQENLSENIYAEKYLKLATEVIIS